MSVKKTVSRATAAPTNVSESSSLKFERTRRALIPGRNRPALVVGLGEILWDELPNGKRLGGAPANFSWHATQLGATGVPVSCVGGDALGREILSALQTMDLESRYITVLGDAATSTVSVQLRPGGTPDYVIHEDVAWDRLCLTPTLTELARQCDAVCVGTLAQRSAESRRAILGFLESTRSECLRVVDVNLRQRYYTRDVIEQTLSKCNILKFNDSELPCLASLLELKGAAAPASNRSDGACRTEHYLSDPLSNESSKAIMQGLLEELRSRFGLKLVALTCGASGSVLLSQEAVSWHPALPVAVEDTVGAGDAFAAALIVGLLQQQSLAEIHELATKVASYVCSQAGGMPVLPACWSAF